MYFLLEFLFFSPAVLQGHNSASIKTHKDHVCPTIGEPPVLMVVPKCVPQPETNINTVHIDT